MSDPADSVGVTFTPEHDTAPNPIDMHAAIIQQNVALLERLATFDKQPNALLLHDLSIETLVDMLFDEDGKQHFQFGVDVRLNRSLKEQIAQLSNQLIVPDMSDA